MRKSNSPSRNAGNHGTAAKNQSSTNPNMTTAAKHAYDTGQATANKTEEAGAFAAATQ